MQKFEQVSAIYHSPLIRLISRAHAIHCRFHQPEELQLCTLISFKTGGCPEDCNYCAQSSHFQTETTPLPLMQKKALLAQAKKAIDHGSTRVCIGAAWRQVRDGKAFDTILEVIEELNQKGVEVCCTLGMLDLQQAKKLKKAGLFAYNHNLDTSSSYYKKIISTRSYEERLETLRRVERAGISVCCGGIIGMGESVQDRISLLHTLANRKNQPESVPINLLVPIRGTPLENQPKLSIWEMVRMIATARIIMPKAMIRLSAGRISRSLEEQALCFLAGANSIFTGEKLLTTPNPSLADDEYMFELFGLKKRTPFKKARDSNVERKKESH